MEYRAACSKTIISSLMLYSMSTAFAADWLTQLSFGFGQTTGTHIQTRRLTISPAPGLTNTYQTDNHIGASLLTNVALSHRLYRYNNSIFWGGLALDSLHHQEVEGILHPFVNVGPNFDTLRYRYAIQSISFFIQGLWQYNVGDGDFTVLGGSLGPTWVQVFDYQEYIPLGSTARPMRAPFQTQTRRNLAYGLSIGWGKKIIEHGSFLLRFRYFNLGRGELNTSRNQQTDERLQAGTITVKLISLGVAVW